MHYVSATSISKAYGIKPLFSEISFHIEQGDKIALIARNGSGKSTLLKIISGQETPDSGKLEVNKNVTVIALEQEPSFQEELSISENLFEHDHPILQAIKDFEIVSEDGDTEKINAAIVRMDELGAWDFDAHVKQVLTRLNIHHLRQPVKNLSGGQRKRAALARTLIDIGIENKHYLLVLDEPTNHLDVDMVEWLEHFLDKDNVTVLLVTHDRYFLDAVCSEIWEMDASSLSVYRGNYENYLEKKSLKQESVEASRDKARNLYRKELAWMRKQPRARTTKSKSRQDRFYEVERHAKVTLEEASMELQMKMNRLGGKVIELKKVYKSFSGKVILKGFDYIFKKGERIGIVGKNGVGKSTFLNIIQGLENPDSGKVNIGDTVIFANYSQQGLLLKHDLRVIEFVKNIAENFPLASGGSLTASQFLNLFLFPADQQYSYISTLSGGEKRRLLLLSILFRNPNFLVLDEPTNDLDLPTLGVLENFLDEFPGCLVIVSHDRYFMDRLVDHLFVFDGEGDIRDFPGNYSQYRDETEREKGTERETETERDSGKHKAESVIKSGGEKRRLTYKEKREFELLGTEIESLNEEKKRIDLQFLQGRDLPYDELQKLSQRIGEIASLLDTKELRWLELSERSEE